MKGNMQMYYDDEADYLELFAGEPKKDYGDHVHEDVVVFRDATTHEAIGLGIFNFRKRAKDLRDILKGLPFALEVTALRKG